MTADRVRRLLPVLPEGVSEIYFHPAVAQDARLQRLMPDYEPAAELAALLDRGLRDLVPNGVVGIHARPLVPASSDDEAAIRATVGDPAAP